MWWYVCYTLAGQEVKAEEDFRQLDETSKWQALVLMGDFSQPKIQQKGNRSEHKQCRRFLECAEDNFLM